MSESTDLVLASDVLVSDESGLSLRHDGSPPAVMRARIDALVKHMLEVAGDDPLPPVAHEIGGGMYMRKLFIPKGMLLAGKIHKVDCCNIVAKGDITILTEFGCRRVGEGFAGISKAGTQKIGFAHADTIFINVFRTDKTELSEIESEIAGTDHMEGPAIMGYVEEV